MGIGPTVEAGGGGGAAAGGGGAAAAGASAFGASAALGAPAAEDTSKRLSCGCGSFYVTTPPPDIQRGLHPVSRQRRVFEVLKPSRQADK